MIQYLNILSNDHNRSSEHLQHKQLQNFSCDKNFKFSSNFQSGNTMLLTKEYYSTDFDLLISQSQTSLFYNWKFVPLIFHPFLLPSLLLLATKYPSPVFVSWFVFVFFVTCLDSTSSSGICSSLSDLSH